MEAFDPLLDRVRDEEDDALDALRDAGAAGATAVVAAILASDDDEEELLAALVEVASPSIADVLYAAFESGPGELQTRVAGALARLGDSRVSARICSVALDPKTWSTRRRQAVDALGDLGDTAVLGTLEKLAERVLGDALGDVAEQTRQVLSQRGEHGVDPLYLLVRLAIAMAKLGDHRLASGVVTLVSMGEASIAREEAPVVHAYAAAALAHTAGPGMLPALEGVIRTGGVEARYRALFPLSLLGTRGAIDALAHATEDSHHLVAQSALAHVGRVTGERFEERRGELAGWWKRSRSTYREDVCYRRGQPICAPLLRDLLHGRASVDEVLNEVCIMSGLDLRREAVREGIAPQQVALRAVASLELRPHSVLKYGKTFDLGVLVREA